MAKQTNATAPPKSAVPKKKRKKAAKKAVAAAPKKVAKKKRAKRRVGASNGNGIAHVSKAIARAESALNKEARKLAAVKAQVRSLQKSIA